MLDKLSRSFSDIGKRIAGKATISEKNIQDTMEEIKVALIDADVNLRVVRRFINKTAEEAIGEKVLRSVDPGQQFIKIVYDRLVDLLGGERQELKLQGPDTTSTILMLGLQGAGKTTTTAKLALQLKKEQRKPLLVACDLQRPAAIEQLKILSEQVGVDFFFQENTPVIEIAQNAIKYAQRNQLDTVLIDTAGRMQANQELLEEIINLKKAVKPNETLLVTDAMTGQNAVDVASIFHEALSIDGVILTKFDSDTRGGAAISIKSITGTPIKYMGTGEKIEDLEPFHPNRIASRILGMGDILSLVEKAQEVTDQEEAEKLQKKILNQDFTLEDMLDQFQQLRKMGSMNKLIEMIPGAKQQLEDKPFDEKDLKRKEAIILSMTKKERANYRMIGPPRRKRIAKGSGTSVADINRLLKEFEKSRNTMKKMIKNQKYQDSVLNNLGIEKG